tara:strand:+ start:341 stop:472 length:132 start_codon:yes stop_codon:yes gene_type:complete
VPKNQIPAKGNIYQFILNNGMKIGCFNKRIGKKIARAQLGQDK